MPPSKPVRPLVVASSISLTSLLLLSKSNPLRWASIRTAAARLFQKEFQYTTNGGRIVLRFDDIFQGWRRGAAPLVVLKGHILKVVCGEKRRAVLQGSASNFILFFLDSVYTN